MSTARPVINRTAVRRIYNEACAESGLEIYRRDLRSGFLDGLEKHITLHIRTHATLLNQPRRKKKFQLPPNTENQKYEY